jgi:FAD/FMN-containing dehydrogenase
LDRRHFIAAAGSATALGLSACGGGGGAAPPPPPPAAPDWAALAGRLQGSVLLPGAAGFALAAPVFNLVYDATVPQALVRCASADDIALALAFARANHLAFAVRSGGHGYTGNSATTGMVIDVGPMNAIAVGSGTATIGAGAKLVDIYDQLAGAGVCIPSGSCPTIGIAGITQGGGIGLVDRAYGLTCDNLVAAQVVLADGSVVTCDASSHADLFWALRGGGGGNFGVVASMTFSTFATRDVTTFSADFAWADAARVFAAWQAWPQAIPDTIWAGLVLGTSGSAGGTPAIELSGLCIGSPADFAPYWAGFLAAAGVAPTSQASVSKTFHAAMLASCGSRSVSQCHLAGETADGSIGRVSFAASSDFFNATLPPEGIQAMLDQMQSLQAGGVAVIVILDLMGGAIGRVPPEATAFVHRNAVFSAQYYRSSAANWSADQATQAQDVVSGLRTTMAPWSSGEAYQNYLDPRLADWQSAYYGANYARLRQVKTAYDPMQVFKAMQGVEPLQGGSTIAALERRLVF